MNFYLIPSLEFGPLIVQRLLKLIPEGRMYEALYPDRFTAREVIAHLAHWESIMRQERIQTALSHPGATIAAYDEGQLALDHHYSERNPLEQAEAFIRERRITAELIRSLREEDWSKTVLHPERGAQSVEDLANLLLGHDLYHIEQLSEYLE